MSDTDQARPGNTEASQKIRPRKRKNFFLRFLLGLFIVLLLLAAALVFPYLSNKSEAWDYIPADNTFYVRVPSLHTAYSKWIDLEIFQIFLRQNKDLAGFENLLLWLRSQDFKDNYAISILSNLEAHAFMDASGQLGLIFDLSWRSMFTRYLGLFDSFIHLDGLQIIKDGGKTWYKYSWAENQSLYVLFENNLAFLGFKPETLLGYLDLKNKGKALSQASEGPILEEFNRTRTADLSSLLNAQALLKGLVSDPGLSTKLQQGFSFSDFALLNVTLSKEQASLEVKSALKAENEDFAKVLDQAASVPVSLRYIPGQVSFYTVLKLAPFKDLIGLWRHFRGQEPDALLKQAEQASTSLLGMDLEELLWSWVGDELGIFQTLDSEDPVFFVSIDNEEQRQKVFTRLNQNVLINIERNLQIDGVAVQRIALPVFLQNFLSGLGIRLETPFFLVRDNMIFLSVNPGNLARMDLQNRSGSVLHQRDEYKKLMEGRASNPSVLMYFDLEKGRPFFMQSDSLLSALGSLYSQGLCALYQKDGLLDIHLSLLSSPKSGTSLVSGFPYTLGRRLSGAPLFAKLKDQSGIVSFSAFDDGTIKAVNLPVKAELFSVQTEAKARVLPFLWSDTLAVLGPSGTLYRYTAKGESVQGFPLMSPLSQAYPVQIVKDKILAYSRKDRQMILVDTRGESSLFGPELSAPVLASAYYAGGLVSFVPKEFEGLVYLSDEEGRILHNWPQVGGGISLGSAPLYTKGAQKLVSFLTQKGDLFVWTSDGGNLPGFPVALGGASEASPCFLEAKNGEMYVAVLQKDGLIKLLDLQGTVIKEARFSQFGEDSRLLALDCNQDGVQELLVWGGGNLIYGFNTDLESLQGFPLQGSWAPFLIDLDSDGKQEILTASQEGKIYAYRME